MKPLKTNFVRVSALLPIVFLSLVCVFASCSDSDSDSAAEPPAADMQVTLVTSSVELANGETAGVRFSLPAWNAAWQLKPVALTSQSGVALTSGCTLTGIAALGDGLCVAYVSAPTAAATYDEKACLSFEISGVPFTVGPFVLKNSAASGADLPAIYVTASAPVADTDTWIDGTFEIKGNGAYADLPQMVTKVKGRGNTTWFWEKKPYALKLDSKKSVLGMPAHKRWCLIANYADRTLMRNCVATYIATQTGLCWTPRARFAEVWFNGTYVGVYQVVEQIKVGSERLAIDEMTEEDNSGDALTGGYLLELDDYFDEANKFRSSHSDMPVNIKYPEEELTDAQRNYIETYFNESDILLFDRYYADPSPRFDIASFIDYWIVNELMGNEELKHPKSFYIHKPRLGRLTAGPVWDFDYGTLTAVNAQKWAVLDQNMWITRLFLSRAVRREARARWEMYYPFLQTVPTYIDGQKAMIGAAAKRNFAKWPNIGTNLPNGDESLSFDEAVERLKSSYSQRLAWLDAQIRTW